MTINELKQAIDAEPTKEESTMNLSQIQDVAAALYDGGWRAADRDEMIEEYKLTSDEADAICQEMERYAEEEEAEEEEEEDEEDDEENE